MKYSDIKQFNLLSLDIKQIINTIQEEKKFSTSKLNSNNTKYLKLHEAEDFSKYIKLEEGHQANALTDQVCLTLIDRFKDDANFSNTLDSNTLKYYLMYANFGEIYHEFYKDNIVTPQGKAFETLMKSGINVSIPKHNNSNATSPSASDYEIIKFVPFDKSGSMSRSYRITFIREDIIEDLNKRLLLNIDFSKIELVPSKYYAYKGLYLSDGVRISTPSLGDLSLNSDNVIVLPDNTYRQYKAKVISNFFDENDSLIIEERDYSSDNSNQEKGNSSFEKKSVKINCFDGEGIISPKLSEIIRVIINQPNLYTFQIRMPFVKGLLHQVDFKQFIKEELLDNENFPHSLYVKDYFGIERDIFKAEIILTESMFKCASWLKEYKSQAASINDPMAYYFEKYNEYNHSLFICNSKHTAYSDHYITFSYQFLNTLKLDHNKFKKLIETHKNRINNLMTGSETSDSCSEKEIANLVSKRSNELKKIIGANENSELSYQKALARNDAFFSDAYIKSLFNTSIDSMSKKIGTGRIFVQGTQRYLSGDLLFLMYTICKNIHSNENNQDNIKSTDKKLNEIYKQRLHQYTMFAPNTGWMQNRGFIHEYTDKGKNIKDHYFGILRNPHYARHEQCMLKLFNNFNNNSLYHKYFNHLESIVMVAHNSLVPMTLGGADFDGDIVKIVADPIVNESIAIGVYSTSSDQQLTRVLPTPQINGKNAVGKIIELNNIDLSTIKNTFGNSIGLISNSAIKLGEKYYSTLDSGQQAETDYTDYNVLCTILAGLEIDAAKSGWHPSNDLNKIISNAKILKQYSFLQNKDIIENTKIPNISVIEKTEKDETVKYYAINKKLITKTEYADDSCTSESNVPNLERLPAYYAHYELNEKPKSFTYGDLTKGKKKFQFENDASWKKHLDKATCSKVRGIVDAYADVLDQTNRHFRYSANYDNYYIACIKHILNKQYHNFKIQKASAYEKLLDAFDRYVPDLNSAKAALDRLENNHYSPSSCPLEWIYTPKDMRFTKLCEILGIDIEGNESDETTLKDSLMLLCNFNHSGYMLLYFLLKTSITKYSNSIFTEHRMDESEVIDNSEIMDTIADNDTKKTEDTDYSSDAVYKKQYDELYDLLLKASQNAINSKQDKNPVIYMLNKHARNTLYNLINEDALKYVYSLTASSASTKYSKFMWNIIKWSDIENNMCLPNEEVSKDA